MAARFTRRTTLGTLAAAAGATVACGQQPAETQPGGGVQDLTGTRVEYWASWAPNHPEEIARLKVMENFSNQNPYGIKVEPVLAGGASPVNMDKITAAMAAGTPPELVNTYNFHLADLFIQGATVDVDAQLKGNAEWKRARPGIYPNIANALTWKGKLFAVPSHNSFFLMYYQPEALRRVGLAPPPRTWGWDAFTDYLKAAARPAEGVHGYNSSWAYEYWGMFLLNNGATILSKDGTKYQLNSPESLQSAEWELSLARAGLQKAHDGSAGGGYAELLPEAKVVFQLAVPNRVRRWLPQGLRPGVDFGTCFYPLGPKNTSRTNVSHGTAYGFAAFKDKDDRKVQARLLAGLWAARVDSGLIFDRDGGVPPSYRHIVEAPDFQAEAKKDAEFWPFYEALPNYIPDPNFPRFTYSKGPINEQLQAIWAGTTSVKDGLNEAQKLAQPVLDEALRR
jgi:ABC-type glycerol-3-phosphate transport system substrate-binding protein